MYVCICKRITDSKIRESVRNGASSFGDVQQQLGVGSCCGTCAELAQEIIQDTQNNDANFLPYAAA